MIDVSARVVYSGMYGDSLTISSSSESAKTSNIKIQLPECDYVELISSDVCVPYSTATTNGTASLKTRYAHIPPRKVILTPNGKYSHAMVNLHTNESGSWEDYALEQPVALSSSYVLTSTIRYTYQQWYYITWHYVCYKYDS